MKRGRFVLIAFLICCFYVSLSFGQKNQQGSVIDFLEVHDADILSVFKQLSEFSGVDIVSSRDVKGSVNLSVSNKSWNEILDIICRINNLMAVNEESYVYVLTAEEFNKRKIDNASTDQVSQNLQPLSREIIKLNNISASDIQTSIESLLSSRGKTTVVENSNAIIIYDTKKNINEIRTMISELDIESEQILIKCKIIEVNSGVIQRLGIHWGYFDASTGIEASHVGSSSNIVTGALDRITYGIISPEKLSVALEYLYSDNNGNVVAQPHITTLDNKEARIFMGQQIPVPYIDEAGNTVYQIIDAGTELIVKPHIAGNGRILLELKPKKESYSLQESGQPIINQQSANTTVFVDNGETVVIAGLTSNETSNVETGIPVLKDIPLIGNFFKKSEKNKDKKDLIIFVTPHIIERGYSAAYNNVPEEIEKVMEDNNAVPEDKKDEKSKRDKKSKKE